MSQTDLWVLLLVLGGAAIMAGSIIQGMRIKRSVSRELAGTWQAVLLLMAFFLAGYLLFASVVAAGIRFPLELVTGVVFFGGACYVYLIIRLANTTFYDLRAEVRERRLAVDELRNSEGRLRSIVESTPMGMHLFRIDEGGRLVLAGSNPAADRILGVAHDPLVGRTIEEAFPRLAGTDVPDRYRSIAATGEMWHGDGVEYESGGTNGYFEVHAFQTMPGRMVAMFLDVTQRQEAEAALRESEKMNRVLVEALPDIVARLDESGTFLSFKGTRGLEDAMPEEQFVGAGLDRLLPPEVAERTMLHLRRALETGETQMFEYQRAEGDILQEFEARVVAGSAGEAIILIRDITTRKRAKSALERAKEELERQNEELLKLDRMKDALISDVSHELKTPVAKHVMQLEILRTVLKRSGVSENVEDIVEIMESGIRRQQNVIRNILMMSRLEAGGRKELVERVRLDGLVEEVVADYSYSIAAIGTTMKIDLERLWVKADREMLWHVFSNLLGNAIKYRSSDAPAIHIEMVQAGGGVVVRIVDNGKGLDPKDRSKIFDRFYQASTSAEGIGLGLSLSRAIVKRFGGDIHLESDGPGLGTTAIVALPAAGEAE